MGALVFTTVVNKSDDTFPNLQILMLKLPDVNAKCCDSIRRKVKKEAVTKDQMQRAI